MKSFRELVEVSLAARFQSDMTQVTGRQIRRKEFRQKTNKLPKEMRGGVRNRILSRYPSGHIPVTKKNHP